MVCRMTHYNYSSLTFCFKNVEIFCWTMSKEASFQFFSMFSLNESLCCKPPVRYFFFSQLYLYFTVWLAEGCHFAPNAPKSHLWDAHDQNVHMFSQKCQKLQKTSTSFFCFQFRVKNAWTAKPPTTFVFVPNAPKSHLGVSNDQTLHICRVKKAKWPKKSFGDVQWPMIKICQKCQNKMQNAAEKCRKAQTIFGSQMAPKVTWGSPMTKMFIAGDGVKNAKKCKIIQHFSFRSV